VSFASDSASDVDSAPANRRIATKQARQWLPGRRAPRLPTGVWPNMLSGFVAPTAPVAAATAIATEDKKSPNETRCGL
jgi:hypothetical protein